MMSDRARQSLLALLAAAAFALSWSVRAQEEGGEEVSSPRVKVSNRRSRQRVEESNVWIHSHASFAGTIIQGGHLFQGQILLLV